MAQHGLSQRWHQFRAGEPSAEGSSHYDTIRDQKPVEKQLMPQKQREHRTAVGAATGGGDEGGMPVSDGRSGHVLFESDSSSSGSDSGSSDEDDDDLSARAAAVRRTQRRARREWCAIVRAASAIQGEFWSQSSVSTVQTQEMRRNVVEDDSSTSCSDDSEDHVEAGQDDDDKTMGLELDGSAGMSGNRNEAHAAVDDACVSLSDKVHEEQDGPLSQPQHVLKKQEVSNTASIPRLEEIRACDDEEHSDHGSYDEDRSDHGKYEEDHSHHGSYDEDHSHHGSYAEDHSHHGSYDEDHSHHGSYDEDHSDYGSYEQVHSGQRSKHSTNSPNRCSPHHGSVDEEHSEHVRDIERHADGESDDRASSECHGVSDYSARMDGGRSVDGFVSNVHTVRRSDDDEHSDYRSDDGANSRSHSSSSCGSVDEEHSEYGRYEERHSDYGRDDGATSQSHGDPDYYRSTTGHGIDNEEHSQYESDDGVNSQRRDASDYGSVDEDHSYHENSAHGSDDEGHSDDDSNDGVNSQSHDASAAASAAIVDAEEVTSYCSSDDASDDSSRSTVSGGSRGDVDGVKTSGQDAAERGMIEVPQDSTWSVMDGIDEDGREQELSAGFSDDEGSMYSEDEESAFMSKQKSSRRFFEEYDYDDEGCKSFCKKGTREVPSGAGCDEYLLGSGNVEGKDAGKAADSAPSPKKWIKTKKWYILSYILVIAGIAVMIALAVPMSKKDSRESSQNDEQSTSSPPTTDGIDNASPHTGGEQAGFGPTQEEFHRFDGEPTHEDTFTSGTAFRTKPWHVVGAKIFAASDSYRSRNDGFHFPSQTGFSVSLSQTGHRVAVGSRHDSSRGMDRAGSVSVYEFTSLLNGGFWRSIGIIHGHFPGDQLGFSVSLSDEGDILAVGALGSDGNGDRSGQVRVFKYDAERMQWAPYGQPLYGANPLDLFGMSVSLSGSGRRLAVGSPYHDSDGADDSGCAVVFEYDALTDQWGEMLGSRQQGTGGENYFGWSVSLSSNGNHLAVGAPKRGGLGYVRLYHTPTSETPRWESMNTIDSEDVDDYFGYSVSLSENGEILAVGAPNGSKNGAGSGYVGVYSNSVMSSSLRGDYLVGGNVGDNKGFSVDLSSNGLRLIVGSPSHDSDNGAKSGRGSMHQFNGQTWDSGIPVYGTEAQGEAGFDVSISAAGTRFAIGLPHRYCTEKCGNGYVNVYE